MTDGTTDRNEEAPAAAWKPGLAWVLVATCALVIGIYFRSAHSGMLELLGVGAEGSYYNLLVRGFQAHQLNVETEVPAGLAQLSDPHDAATSAPYRWLANNPVHDLSYYHGKLYLYFGVTPALMLFWPYAVLSGKFLLHKDAIALFFSVGFLAGAGLLWSMWRRYFAEVGVWTVAACLLAFGIANLTPVILQRSDVWEVAISCGYALTMLALLALWAALHQPQRRTLWLFLASVAYGLAIGARPSLLFGAVILLAPLGLRIADCGLRIEKQGAQSAHSEIRNVLAVTLPMLLIGIGLMWYNFARFGSPFEFGQRYQLPTPQGFHEGISQFSPRYLWFNFHAGFLNPATWSGSFPFVDDAQLPAMPKGADAEHPFGLLTNVPIVWLALAAPLAWRGRSIGSRSTLRLFVAVVALLFVIFTLTIGLHNSMCVRYQVEFAAPLLLLAVVGIFGIESALREKHGRLLAARCGWVLLLLFSVGFNLLAGHRAHAEALHSKGSALMQKGKQDEAIAVFDQVLQIDPRFVQSENNIAIILYQRGKFDEAVSHYRHVLEIKPDYVDARSNLAFALAAAGKLDESAAELEEVLRRVPGLATALNYLGTIRFNQGRRDEAMECFRKAVESDPNYVDARKGYAAVLTAGGRREEAVLQLKEALRLKPDDPEARQSLNDLTGRAAP